jgi:hypothetical protein
MVCSFPLRSFEEALKWKLDTCTVVTISPVVCIYALIHMLAA